MKKTSIFVMFLALGLFACSDSKPGDSEFLTVDVTAYYPPKDIYYRTLWMWNMFH